MDGEGTVFAWIETGPHQHETIHESAVTRNAELLLARSAKGVLQKPSALTVHPFLYLAHISS